MIMAGLSRCRPFWPDPSVPAPKVPCVNPDLCPAIGVGRLISDLVAKAKKRMDLIEENCLSAVELMVRFAAVGHPFSKAPSLLSSRNPGPLAVGIRVIADETAYGRGHRRAPQGYGPNGLICRKYAAILAVAGDHSRSNPAVTSLDSAPGLAKVIAPVSACFAPRTSHHGRSENGRQVPFQPFPLLR